MLECFRIGTHSAADRRMINVIRGVRPVDQTLVAPEREYG
jgi:hypothetical protein